MHTSISYHWFWPGYLASTFRTHGFGQAIWLRHFALMVLVRLFGFDISHSWFWSGFFARYECTNGFDQAILLDICTHGFGQAFLQDMNALTVLARLFCRI